MLGTTFDQFDTVVVPFPFTDKAAIKRRPALTISTRDFNASHQHAIFAMITTAARSAWPSDLRIRDLDAAGLKTPCVLRLKLFTLETALVVRRLGRLGAGDRRAARLMLADTLGLTVGG